MSYDIHFNNGDAASAFSQVQNVHAKLTVLISDKLAVISINVLCNCTAQSSQYRHDHLTIKSYVGNLFDIDLYC